MSDLNQNKSFNYSSFSEFCFHKDELPAETRHTVEVLFKVAGTDDFLEAERVLLNEKELDLDYPGISDLSPLATLKNLNYLWLSDNNISDLTPLQVLINLTGLVLSTNQINDITPLNKLTKLNTLTLDNNQINDITPLETLINLQELDLDNNYISDISPLQSLNKLANLRLYANKIRDLTSLYNLEKISELDISCNQITDLKVLQPLKYITELDISGNPLSGFNSPRLLIDKYQKLLPVPLNRQKSIQAVNLTYSLIGLNQPQVIFASDCKSWYVEIINLLKSNYTKNQSLKSFILQQKRQAIKIDELIHHRQLDYLHHLNNKIPNKSIYELTKYRLNQSVIFREVKEALYLMVTGLAFSVLNNSSLKTSLEAYSTVEHVISSEQIIHQIYLIETYQSLLKITLDEKTQQWYDCLNQLFENCGWFIPFEDVCIVCDRPSKFSLDSENRLHSESEPAIQFADGYGLYYYHGVALPEQYGTVHPNQWEAKWLLSENNTELRRILIQAIGYNRICDELKAIKLNSFREYDLIKIDAEADVEPIVLLKMICPSTGYTHVLRVPPNMESAREAITWINWGVDPQNFAVES
ncbi:MAG: DUF6745 domain-containing protein [Cyanobacteria bacterium J06621_15]